MIKTALGQEEETFIRFIENTLSLLAEEKYDDFIAMYDSSRMSGQELLLALRYLDDRRPIVKIDDPAKTEPREPLCIDFGQFRDGSGYWMDYDLFTGGRRNDLTLQVVFSRQDTDYFAVLSDLRTL